MIMRVAYRGIGQREQSRNEGEGTEHVAQAREGSFVVETERAASEQRRGGSETRKKNQGSGELDKKLKTKSHGDLVRASIVVARRSTRILFGTLKLRGGGDSARASNGAVLLTD